jgi:hypothetical protein
MSTHHSENTQLENRWMNTCEYKKESQKNKFMKYSLEKWGRAPIIFGGSSTHYFGGSSTHYFKRARALIIQRGTSTHCSKTTKQRTSEQTQNGHERNKFMKCCLGKMRARTHYFWGLEHLSFWGLEHSLFRRARALIISRGLSCTKIMWHFRI